MKSNYFLILVVLLMVWGSPSALADLMYFNDFEGYAADSFINGVDGWSSGGPAKWWVANPANWDPPIEYAGNILSRGSAFSQYGQDYATLHLFDEEPIESLRISMNYLLQGNELGSVEISGDSSNWVNATEELEIIPRFSNDITWYATSDLSHLLDTAGIQNDLYVRFMAWNPTYSSEWHVFAIDNLQIITPEPATILLLGLGGVFLRRRS